MGDGTLSNPFDLSDALRAGVLIKNDTLYLSDGVYSGNFLLNASGINNGNIKIKPLNSSSKPIIDGNLTITGNNIRIENIFFNNSSFTDRSALGAGMGMTSNISVNGSSVEIINCVFKNGYNGATSSSSVNNVLFYGCIFSLCGFDSQLGHGMYIQNSISKKTAKHCIFHDNFGYGCLCWGTAGDTNYFDIIENISFKNGFLRTLGVALPNYHIGGQTPNEGHNIIGNISIDGEMRVGDAGLGNLVENTDIENNILDNSVPLRFAEFDEISGNVEGNEFYGNLQYGTTGFTDATWPNNSYLNGNVISDRIYKFVNEYDSNKLNVCVFNKHALLDNISVNVFGTYNNGDEILIRNVQDYENDIQTVVVSENSVLVNMEAANRTQEAPVGWTEPNTVFPSYGVFVFEKA